MSVLSKLFIVTYLLIIAINSVFAQGLSKELEKKVDKLRYARIMFYNCENLFDVYNDTLINDEEFLPEGDKHWNSSKYYHKLSNISKVITAVGGWKPPELVGLCEVENQKVLFDLTMNSPLYHFGYKVIHKDSPDTRGIDVALLYQPKSYNPIVNRFVNINFPSSNSRKTRDILYSKGVLLDNDTIHLFVNHWPSRWGGQLESEPSRLYVASVLKCIIDSILVVSDSANVIIMGDFNDEPTDKSISKMLNSTKYGVGSSSLCNLSISSNYNVGTLKYRGVWSVFDQIIVSENIIGEQNGMHIDSDGFVIFDAEFLLKHDTKYLGYKPFRTFNGYRYIGGFSDHLPIFIDINKQ